MIENGAALARQIVTRLKSRGFSAYFVGGCVRDLLMQRAPKDYDVATSATPAEVLGLFPGANQVGAHFGVVLIADGEHHVEVATFRSDHSYSDGRHPGHVVFEQDPAADARRRDFTINALMLDPDSGQILDFTGGRSDLDRGVVRAIGEPSQRFAEDHLRMLRAVRFAARFRFEIDPATMAAIQAEHASILRVSPERNRDELIKILIEGGARRGFELLDESGLLLDLLPEIAALKGVEQPPEFHPEGDVWTHTLMMIEQMSEPTPVLAMGVLLHDVGKPGTFRRAPDRIRFDGHVELGVAIAARILKRFRFSNEDSEQILALVANHMKFIDATRMRASTLKRFLRMEGFPQHLELHRLDCSNSNGNLATYEFVKEQLDRMPSEQLHPERLLSGDDLISLGYAPGKHFSEMLRAIEDAQLEGVLATRDDALRFVRERWNR